MSNLKYYSIFIILMILGISLPAQSIDFDYLSTWEFEQLLANEILIKVHKDRNDIVFLPQCNFTEKIDKLLKEIDPNILVETMVLLPFSIEDVDIQLESYNMLHSISALIEAEYYSEKKEGYHSIFHESYRIESTKNLTIAADFVNTSIPDYASILISQRPASLINVVSGVEYYFDQNQICMTIENLTDIKFHFLKLFRVVKPHKMSTITLLLPYGDSSLLYVLGSADAFRLFGIGADKTENLIYNRTIGMMNYYIAKLSGIGK